VKVDNTLMPLSFTRTLRLKVRAEAYAWLNATAIEVNEVFNYCNETTDKAATRPDTKQKLMSGFDLCYLTAGATTSYDRIGAGIVQSVCVTCSACGALSAPRGVNGLTVRSWICSGCGESHDRAVNAARNIMIGYRSRTSMHGNESSPWLIPPSSAYCVREAGIESVRAAA
jgi:hypothetical protein